MDYSWIKLIAVFVCGLVLSADLAAGQEECKDCVHYGIKFPPNKPFEYRVPCLEMTGCYCYCNGIARCEKERNLCDRSVSSARDFYSSTRTRYESVSNVESGRGSGKVITDVRSSQCRKCSVGDMVIDGGTYFSHTNGCISYSSCFCGCDGNWQCPAENAKNKCTGSGSGTIIGLDNSGGCQSCVIDGVPYVGNSDFSYRNNCIEWSDCRCRCDGSWKCESTSGKWVCDNICRECEVGGKKYPGKSSFRYEKGCIVYDPCTCNCDGSWDCPAENGKWICTDTCLKCTVNGKKYDGKTSFKFSEDCWEWDPCTCNCDGSWECPRENAKWICTDRCLDCEVKGNKYEGNSLFKYEEGCYEYNCNCNCDGKWSCPANRTRDICRLNMATGCYYCDVNGERFDGNSLFSYEDTCVKYDKCTCNCDGSWECPGERATYTCRRNSTTGCNYCDVYGQKVMGRTRFEMQQDCWRYDCDCDCNGNWRCYDTGAQYICGNQLLDTNGCKSCLAEGQSYSGQSSFEISWGCIKYQCSCNCDGSWICPSRLAKNSCSNLHFQNFLIRSITNLPTSWCSECTIGGSIYPGYSQLEYQEKCIRRYARCFCSGGYRFDSSLITGCTESSHISISKGNCIQCVFNNKTYATGSDFEFTSQCKRYRCQCECNGKAACLPVADNVCGSVLTTITSSEVVGGGGRTVVVGGGGGRTVVVGGGGGVTRTEEGRLVTGGGGGTLVVGGGGSTRETVVTTGGGTRTVVVDTGITADRRTGTVVTGTTGTTERRTVVVGNGGRTGTTGVVVGGGGGGSSKETRVLVTSGGGTTSTGRTVITGGGGGTTSTGTTVVRVDGTGSSTGGVLVSTNTETACYHCVGLDGKKYPGNSEFNFRRGCAVWKCQCNCYGRAICRPHDISACLVEPRCRDCVVDGRTYRSNRMFSYEKDCVLHQCRCMCDGRPRCVQTASLECEEKNVCKKCVVNGQFYQPNTMFDLTSRCRKQRCQCDCNGKYRCSRAVNTCGEEVVVGRCDPCELDGKSYEAGTTFTVDRGCWRTTCSCSCTNRLTCDQSAATNLCDLGGGQTCRTCNVDGERYAPNRKFEREIGCIRKDCYCKCDGNYDCVDEGVNICANATQTGGSTTKTETRTETTRTTSETTRTSTNTGTGSGTITTNQQCKPCVADRIRRRIGVPFCLDRGCKRYTCECNCNGRFGCQTDKPENICNDAGKVIPKPCDKAAFSTGTSIRTDKNNQGSSTTRTEITETKQTGGGRTTVTTETNTGSGTTVFQFEELRGGVALSSADRRGRCAECSVDGQSFDGNTRFSLQRGCKNFRCTCYCDGTWVCPRQRPRNTCPEKETCRSCTIRGKTYAPNTNFTIDIDKCRKYQCTCPCSGRFNCPRENILNVCSIAECKECVFENGNRYRGNAVFSYEDGCDRFNCMCSCDGSWNCPAERTENICTGDSNRCRTCTVKGKTYRGRSRFSYEDGCDKFNCDCNCDGSWNCPAERTENICTGGSRGCRTCTVKGKTYEGRSRFSYEDGCNKFNCDCNCDGSWNCPAERTENICTGGSRGCRTCTVKGKTYRGRSRFSYEDGCFEYNCDCNCDGSWNCPSSRTKRICDEDGNRISNLESLDTTDSRNEYSRSRTETRISGGGVQTGTNEDRSRTDSSTGDRRVIDSRTRETITTGSELQTGTNDRSSSRTDSRTGASYESKTVSETINNSGKKTISTSTITGGSQTTTEVRSRSGTTTGSRVDRRGCHFCVLNGIEHQPGRPFQFEDGCFRFNCDCNCDGSWNCPAERTANICPQSCRECIVNGRKYPANTVFEYEDGCWSYNCDCFCDGSFKCPSARTKNICSGRPTKCKNCLVENGEEFESNTRFQYEKGCIQYDCDCSCDGSWRCPSNRAKNICAGLRETTCRNCKVNDKSYPPNKDFSYIDDCELKKCSCRCDGTHHCPSSDNICNTKICRDCLVKGNRYIANKPFQYTERCLRYNCDCMCNGSWNCPADRTENLCRTGQCKSCSVRSKSYQGNSVFVLTENCRQFECQCHCDGRWECSKESVNVCNSG